ncbi:MAG: cupin domain-containing protein [Acidimicrobiales bacterium]
MPATRLVIPCADLDSAIAEHERRGYRLSLIRPADAPRTAVLDRGDEQVRLDCTVAGDPFTEEVTDGLDDTLPANTPKFVISRAADGDFGTGRAGMQYRDLIPERQGGRYIASHIAIPEGGPVPDYVHHHHIRFQMIFCHAGWADLVYEDQGPPFRMEAGDCVLQPPHIRHRVLHTSDAFEVVEISSPAAHDTLRDHDLELPNDALDPDRDFGGQTFVWHRAGRAEWTPWGPRGFEHADFGIGAATGGLARVATVRADGTAELESLECSDEFCLWFVRSGTAELHRNGQSHALVARDAVALFAGDVHALTSVSRNFEFLDVRVSSLDGA